jgi:hypothetical protein
LRTNNPRDAASESKPPGSDAVLSAIDVDTFVLLL